MKNVTLKIECKPASSIRELMDSFTLKRKLGMLYFTTMTDGSIVARVVTEQTNPDHLRSQIEAGKLFIPNQTIKAETQ